MKNIPLARSKILSCYHEIKQIARGEIPVPRSIKIFPVEICNHRCKGCHSLVLFSGAHPYLDTNLYYRLIDEWSTLGVESVSFAGGGEPLMHPKISKFIEYAYRKKMGVGILTNGTLLDQEKIDTILSYGTFIRIGIDGADRQVYAEQTGVDHFGLLLDNIRRMISRKKKLKSKITVGLKFLITKINYCHVKKACSLASRLGVDYLQFKTSRSNAYEINSLCADKVNRVIAEEQSKLNRRGFFIFGDARRTNVSGKCFLNMVNSTLDTDGSLYICPAFQHRKRVHRIASLVKESFAKAWFSKKHKDKVKRIDMQQCRLYNCSLFEAHGVAKEAILEDKLHLQFI
ncbi:MAG: radical SAM protein [Candidatus Omnitrophota bacterium]|jgi:MoaA/NifB/PqqE/SkfB family radical SAM enzyme